MKKLILSILLIGVMGCGLEDYQRDILGIIIAQNNSGSDGLDCWDFSEDAVCDEDEDWNGPDGFPDGICNAWDCQGASGELGEIIDTPTCTTVCHCSNNGECTTKDLPSPGHLRHGDSCGACE